VTLIGNRMRVSPAVYNNDADVDRLLETLGLTAAFAGSTARQNMNSGMPGSEIILLGHAAGGTGCSCLTSRRNACVLR
jgi:hypothetical protein